MSSFIESASIFAPVLDFIDTSDEQKEALKFFCSLDEGERLSVCKHFKTAFGQ